MAGVTFSMKNMYGVIDKPFLLHANGCNPAVADLNCIPEISCEGVVYRRRRNLLRV